MSMIDNVIEGCTRIAEAWATSPLDDGQLLIFVWLISFGALGVILNVD